MRRFPQISNSSEIRCHAGDLKSKIVPQGHSYPFTPRNNSQSKNVSNNANHPRAHGMLLRPFQPLPSQKRSKPRKGIKPKNRQSKIENRESHTFRFSPHPLVQFFASVWGARGPFGPPPGDARRAIGAGAFGRFGVFPDRRTSPSRYERFL